MGVRRALDVVGWGEGYGDVEGYGGVREKGVRERV